MRSILKIALLELKQLFYSPIAWLVFIVFTVRTGADFVEKILRMAKSAEMGGEFSNLTVSMFNVGNGIYRPILEVLMFGMPFLTMNLMSREYNTGSIKLLLSSPVTSMQIVLGKFLSMLIYSMGFILIILMMMTCYSFVIINPDWPMMLSGLLGIFLLICLYSAVGLFMSGLSQYQIVSAISTIIVFALLKASGSLWGRFDYLREVSSFIATGSKIQYITSGYLTTRNLLYFISFTALFLILLVIRMESSRRTRHWTWAFSWYLSCTAFIILLGYFSARPALSWYADMTRSQNFTLRKEGREVVGKIKGGLKIHMFINVLDVASDHFYKRSNIGPLKNQFSKFQRYLPEIDYEFTYFYDSVENPELFNRYKELSERQIAQKIAKRMELDFDKVLSPHELRKIADLRPEGNHTLYRLELNGKYAFVRVSDSPTPGEENTVAALKQLLGINYTVGFLSQNGERDISRAGDLRNYGRMAQQTNYRFSLLNQGFSIRAVDIKANDVPDSVQTLVIADPQVAYSPVQLDRIQRYIAKGGNLVILGEPGKQGIINQVISSLGVILMPGRLLQQNEGTGPTFIIGEVSPSAEKYLDKFELIRKRNIRLELMEAAGLQVDRTDFHVDTLAVTNVGNTWSSMNMGALDTGLVVQPKPGDQKGKFPLALALERKISGKNQRIAIFGDADLMSNASLTKAYPGHYATANHELFSDTFRWMSMGVFPVLLSRIEPIDNKFLIMQPGAKLIKAVFLFVFPGVLLLAGFLILLRRNRK